MYDRYVEGSVDDGETWFVVFHEVLNFPSDACSFRLPPPFPPLMRERFVPRGKLSPTYTYRHCIEMMPDAVQLPPISSPPSSVPSISTPIVPKLRKIQRLENI